MFFKVTVPEYPDGNFVGPTIITGKTFPPINDNVDLQINFDAGMNPSMKAYTEEIFGPVLCVVTVDTLDEVSTYLLC